MSVFMSFPGQKEESALFREHALSIQDPVCLRVLVRDPVIHTQKLVNQ